MINKDECVKVSIYKPFPDLRLGCRIYCEKHGVEDFKDSNYIVFAKKKFNKVRFYNEVYKKYKELLEFVNIIFKIRCSVYFKDYISEMFPNKTIISTKLDDNNGLVPEDAVLMTVSADNKDIYMVWINLNLNELIELIKNINGTLFDIYSKKIVEAIDRVTSRKLNKEGLNIFESMLKYLIDEK